MKTPQIFPLYLSCVLLLFPFSQGEWYKKKDVGKSSRSKVSVELLLDEAQMILNNFSAVAEINKEPGCFWVVPSAFNEILSYENDIQGAVPNINKNAKKQGHSKLVRYNKRTLTPKMARRQVRFDLADTMGLIPSTSEAAVETNPVIQVLIKEVRLKTADPDTVQFVLKKTLKTTKREITVNLRCPGRAYIFHTVGLNVEHKILENWKFLFYPARKTLKISTPSGNTYLVSKPLLVLNNLLKQTDQFAKGKWTVTVDPITTNLDPQKEVLSLSSSDGTIADNTKYFVPLCERCSTSEFMFYTLITARNILGGRKIKLSFQPKNDDIGVFEKPILRNTSPYYENEKFRFLSWLDQEPQFIIASPLNDIAYDSNRYGLIRAKAVYIEFITANSGAFFIENNKKLKIVNFKFTPREKTLKYSKNLSGIQMSLDLAIGSDDFNKAIIEQSYIVPLEFPYQFKTLRSFFFKHKLKPRRDIHLAAVDDNVSYYETVHV